MNMMNITASVEQRDKISMHCIATHALHRHNIVVADPE
jgi:hypothetical protein